MEIIKLDNICDVKTGNKNKENNDENGLFPFYTRSQIILKSNNYTIDEEAIIIPGEGSFIPMWNTGKAAIHQRTYIIKSSNLNKLLNKYLYYWWFKNYKILKQSAVGSTVKSLRKFHFLKPQINLPNLKYQQDIISIIEPFENLNNSIINLIFKLKIIYLNIINNHFSSRGLMRDNEIIFKKGINFNRDMLSNNKEEICFINVSAINNNANKFIKNNYKELINTKIGDIILSLDANVGLVNNFLFGINGYGFKVFSKNEKFKNYQIYFSLLNKFNQQIMQKFATGTTIKHANRAKNHLILLDFLSWNKFLKLIYEYEIKLKMMSEKIKLIISNLIKLLVK